MEPDVLHLILCDDVRTDPQNYHRYDIIGLITSIRSTASYPLVQPRLLALVVWTGGQGPGELVLRIVEDDAARAVFRTRPRQIRFVGEAGSVGGVLFRIVNCLFPAAGLYWVEILFAGSVVARQRLFLRS